jgi:predicted lipoprotein with Yx(FWY)xxD motif
MRPILYSRWSTLLLLGALAACSSDRRQVLPEDSAGVQSTPGTQVGDVRPEPGTPGVRDPNLGPPPASLPDSFGGVVPGAAAILKTTTRAGLGTYLTDSVGRPMYVSDADVGGESICHDNCALTFRPAFASNQPAKAEAPIHTQMISSYERPDFPPPHRQLRYNGMPLYYYDADAGTNNTTAQGIFVFGAHWYLVTPDGQALGKKATVNYLGTGSGRGGQ